MAQSTKKVRSLALTGGGGGVVVSGGGGGGGNGGGGLKKKTASATSRNIELFSHFSTEETARVRALFDNQATPTIRENNGKKIRVLKREMFNR